MSTQGKRAWLAFKRRRSAVVGAVLVGFLVLAGVFGPLLAPYDPDERHAGFEEHPPSAQFWFGTDELGRDLFSGVIYGARVTLLVGCISVGLALSVGLVLGSISGYLGGRVDLFLQRVVDVMMSFPSILLAILIVALTEKPSLTMAMVAVGIVGIPTYTRLVRATVLQQREQEYVTAAKAMGASTPRILIRGILPNIVAPVTVQATLGFATAILEAAGLSFLGLGAQPPTKEWGLMVKAGWDTWSTSPWIITFPGACIFVAVLSLNLLGDGLRDVLDPRQRGPG
ncbi:MAG: ABC transporter permease [Acidobacteriota bacterium]